MNRFIEKLASGRFFSTVSIVLTYCFAIIVCVIALLAGKLSVDAFLGIFTGFSALAGNISTAYFNKNKTGGQGNA